MHKNNVLVKKFITHLEKAGVNVFFNQASTGRVSGITYFMGDFKATARKLARQTAGQERHSQNLGNNFRESEGPEQKPTLKEVQVWCFYWKQCQILDLNKNTLTGYSLSIYKSF